MAFTSWLWDHATPFNDAPLTAIRESIPPYIPDQAPIVLVGQAPAVQQFQWCNPATGQAWASETDATAWGDAAADAANNPPPTDPAPAS